ncbi:MAG: immunoglobulin domain-containing protein [Candidatus Kapabacteria bacterium]|nr:immunoglobulin domain-containing protein [Candidatus Kapabacteria bacterium]
MKKFATILIILIVAYGSVEIYATKTGRATRTSTISAGCAGSGCHASSKNTAVQLTATSSKGNFIFKPEESASITIKVAHSTAAGAGVNAAIKTSITGEDNTGTISAVSGTKTIGGEITHSTPKEMSNGYAEFGFTWKAPKVPGKYYLRAIGCGVDLDDKAQTSEQWNWMEPIEVIVKGITITEPKSGIDFCVNNKAYIRWSLAGITHVNIELSSDGGNTWSFMIVSNFNAVGGAYVWDVPAGFKQGDNYKLKISDVNDATVATISDRFGIFGNFTITKDPIPATLCVGDDYKMWVEVEGTGIKYQWRKNGHPIPGATDSVYTIKNVQENSDGHYGVLLSSSCNIIMPTKDAEILVRGSTKILQQPSSYNACIGEEVAFYVEADGYSVTYQWYKNNSEIKDAKSDSYVISSVRAEDVGNYTCKVTGYCGAPITTNIAKLALNSVPTLTKQPSSQTLCEKQNLNLSVTATGLELIYTWYHNGSKIGTNSPNLSVTNLTPSNAGEYYCEVRNPCGTIQSNKATIKVDPLPKITSQTNIQQVVVGETVTLRVTAEDADSYQWYKNNVIIEGANTPEYIIENSVEDDSGNYQCRLKNSCGEVNSIIIKVSVLLPQPGARMKYSASNINFDVIPLGYVLDTTSFIIHNVGDADLLIDSIRIGGLNIDQFEILAPGDSVTILPNDSLALSVKCTPTISGSISAHLKFFTNSITDAGLFNLYSFGGIFHVITNRKSVFFGTLEIGESDSREFTMLNQSNYKVKIVDIVMECNESESSFELVQPTLPFTIDESSLEYITMTFSPKYEGEIDCQAYFVFERIDSTVQVEFLGNGLPTSVEDWSNLTLLFPNPATDYIEISYTSINPTVNRRVDETAEIKIFNTLGECVMTTPHPSTGSGSGNLRIDISHLTRGVYFVKIGEDVQIFVKE